MIKKRIDDLLLETGLETFKKIAISKILAGKVIVNNHRVDKPGSKIDVNSKIRIKNKINFVSRGALKLEHALKLWPIKIKNKICLDVGSSTGGFTEILLLNGAAKVFAVDVGYGQLAWKLRNNIKVINLERTNFLKLTTGDITPKPEIATVDVSFISLIRILPNLKNHLSLNSYIYALIKPQFELKRNEIDKGGIVKNEKFRKKACDNILNYAEKIKLKNIGICESPIKGKNGNIEYLTIFKISNKK